MISEYNLKTKNKSDTLGKVNLENKQDSKTNQESEIKYYCVIGACKKISDVKLFRQIVKREYNLTTEVIQNSRKSWYLIYSKSGNNINQIQLELQKMKKINTKDIFIGNLWIYNSKP